MSAPLLSRVQMMVSRAVVRIVNDALKLQGLQVELLDSEAQEEVERFQNYGMSARPKDGAEAIILCVGGLRSHAVVIAVDDRRYRLRNLEEGEVALYDDQGRVVHLRRDGIFISAPDKVIVEAPEVTVISDAVSLGATGGPAVARVGDPVADGVITAGSAKVTAA